VPHLIGGLQCEIEQEMLDLKKQQRQENRVQDFYFIPVR
jgi:hypothetical protein